MNKPFTVGLAGGSGSGKTLFLKRLLDFFTPDQICLISQDNYYKPRHLQPMDPNGIHNFDTPDSIDFRQFARDIQEIREGKTVLRNEYTFNNPQRKASMLTFSPAPVIMVEGIYVLYYRELAEMLDLRIFIEAKDHIKIKRRILRDKVERGYDLDDVLYRYEHHVMPSYERYIEPYRHEADFIIPNNKNFDMALDILKCYLKEKIVHTAHGPDKRGN